ncbi:hypothetical protein [Mycobacterium talmoniae]|uniref:Uncharacterized protein n=1 Tax=Mycobacterium talmoniae TaxID=1858794 RepID=A0A1S1NDK5_9MYCO|nr:hypothetical protein [Mycobacterium talmoniae]OHV03710.1 hypothetical protein BKN37_13640 [Mycobacterium talmoniae]
MPAHSAPKPGWLLVMPDGHPYTWHARSNYPHPHDVWKWLEPDPGKCAALVARGWTVRAGSASELITPVPARVSA